MTTIKDVANKANVSVATVSRVLNQRGYVSEDALSKVLQAIKELDYQPNSVARTLYNKTSNMIGLIVPDIQNPFFPELARAVEDVANIYGYTVVLCNSDQDEKKEREYVDALKQKYIDGLIMSTHHQQENVYSAANIPVVALDRVGDERLPAVVSNNYNGGWKAAEYLVERGATRLAHIRGPRGITSSEERYNGFMAYIKNQGLDCVIEECPFQLNPAEELAERFYAAHPHIDGVFASNDVVAAGFLKVALKQKIPVPDRLQLIGFDGIAFGHMMYPELTTVAQPIYEMGALASRLCIKLIEGRQTEQLTNQLPVQIQLGGTTRGA
ncbi:LacI family DNA-binding transcriptional regulator [Natribacillus halophilus]|uniref:Transcriptional regulator, LacI family n=1 Tax=Natribacillus halophilus TaxID=549003 RepID=A0A1G8KEL1_9BACI|nr:LacI family DNA-binding transcriptional regulator [Natribacillus halophilus]SDI41848.1 transcriptional regulator, LacI family [Natribacillus halophilus]